MSSIKQLSVLAFAAGALAVPGFRNVGHNHGHQHLHSSYRSGSAVGTGSGVPYPLPVANATGIYGSTGTGLVTGTSLPSVSSSAAGPATVTVSPYAAIASSSVAVEPVDVASSSTCTTDVTVTTTQKTYITVTATGPSPPIIVSATANSTAPAATVYSTVHVTLSSSSAFPTLSTFSALAKGYRKWTRTSNVPSSATSTSVYIAPTTTSTSVYVAPSTTSTSVYVAPTTSTSVYVAPTTSSAAVYSSTTASSAAPVSTGKSGKRGVAYNDASLTSYFSGSQVSWAYNWGSSTTGLASGLSFIPTLWGPASDFTNSWSTNAAAAIKSGSQYLFSFNEPDLSSQSNLTPEAAAAAYKTYMMPFAGQAKLCAPSVTNGGGSMGLTWLANFIDACTDCQIDCVSIHWYDDVSNTEYFKEHVTNATTIFGKEVFVSEFAPNNGAASDISTFLETVMPWMDSNDNVAGYAYFMASDGLLVSGSGLSSYGSTYNSYTS